jgi:hypothetical protein
MNKQIYEFLLSVAKERNYTTYAVIAPMAGLDMDLDNDRREIGELLGEISRFEHKKGRPLLSVVVIHREDNIPGPGFFTLAKELGIYKGGDDLMFFIQELARVHDYWSKSNTTATNHTGTIGGKP